MGIGSFTSECPNAIVCAGGIFREQDQAGNNMAALELILYGRIQKPVSLAR
jgi:hypothetical protein